MTSRAMSRHSPGGKTCSGRRRGDELYRDHPATFETYQTTDGKTQHTLWFGTRVAYRPAP